jgi:hypothetical protein
LFDLMACWVDNVPMNATANISIRSADAHDYPTIWQVAALDDSPVPGGPLLVAELEGEVIAAVSLDSGRAIADPFQHTAEAVDLLRLRASQLDRQRAVAA